MAPEGQPEDGAATAAEPAPTEAEPKQDEATQDEEPAAPPETRDVVPPRPEPVGAGAETEAPAKPKRRGWWSLGR